MTFGRLPPAYRLLARIRNYEVEEVYTDIASSDTILSLFNWSETPEGAGFWVEVDSASDLNGLPMLLSSSRDSIREYLAANYPWAEVEAIHREGSSYLGGQSADQYRATPLGAMMDSARHSASELMRSYLPAQREDLEQRFGLVSPHAIHTGYHARLEQLPQWAMGIPEIEKEEKKEPKNSKPNPIQEELGRLPESLHRTVNRCELHIQFSSDLATDNMTKREIEREAGHKIAESILAKGSIVKVTEPSKGIVRYSTCVLTRKELEQLLFDAFYEGFDYAKTKLEENNSEN